MEVETDKLILLVVVEGCPVIVSATRWAMFPEIGVSNPLLFASVFSIILRFSIGEALFSKHSSISCAEKCFERRLFKPVFCCCLVSIKKELHKDDNAM